MTALIVLGAIAAGLTALLAMKVGARVSFGDGLELRLIVGPVRKRLRLDDKPGGGAAKPRAEPESSGVDTEKKARPASPSQSGFDTKKLIRFALGAVPRFIKLLRVDELRFRYVAGGRSADRTAIAYGRACAAIGALLPFMDRYLRVRRRSVTADLDFGGGKTRCSGVIQVTVTVGAALMFGLWALIGLMKCRKENINTKENGHG
ncbi:MAG: hypothetical protein FWH16_05125 [Oscillospiraceae bacterium]|nr:hypothetical protein [Oscillospiraceae bacterium]